MDRGTAGSNVTASRLALGDSTLEELLEAAFYKWLLALRASSLKSPLPTSNHWPNNGICGHKNSNSPPAHQVREGTGQAQAGRAGGKGLASLPAQPGPGIPRILSRRPAAWVAGGSRSVPLGAEEGSWCERALPASQAVGTEMFAVETPMGLVTSWPSARPGSSGTPRAPLPSLPKYPDHSLTVRPWQETAPALGLCSLSPNSTGRSW